MTIVFRAGNFHSTGHCLASGFGRSFSTIFLSPKAYGVPASLLKKLYVPSSTRKLTTSSPSFHVSHQSLRTTSVLVFIPANAAPLTSELMFSSSLLPRADIAALPLEPWLGASVHLLYRKCHSSNGKSRNIMSPNKPKGEENPVESLLNHRANDPRQQTGKE